MCFRARKSDESLVKQMILASRQRRSNPQRAFFGHKRKETPPPPHFRQIQSLHALCSSTHELPSRAFVCEPHEATESGFPCLAGRTPATKPDSSASVGPYRRRFVSFMRLRHRDSELPSVSFMPGGSLTTKQIP